MAPSEDQSVIHENKLYNLQIKWIRSNINVTFETQATSGPRN